ncbi:MAG: alpha/beta hydrolase [Acidobacteriota bacterium]|nr:alpha/beta hydrolase [Acidobacteriota bacterium]
MTARDIELQLPHIRIAAREWGDPDGEPVLAIHGWLDNAASFDTLAPMLPGLHLVAIDLPGHGRSQHRPPGVVHHFVDWVPEVAAAADALGWDSFSLLGHSMGAGIASLVPAVFPGRVRRVVLLEGAGPLAADARKAAEQLVSALADEARAGGAEPRIFPDLDSAVVARRRDTDLPADASRRLVERGTEVVEGGVQFTHDPRLKTRSRLRFTEDQVLAFLTAIECPVLAVKASQGWPFPEDIVEARMAAIPRLERAEVDGGHHVHLTHPGRVAPPVAEFLSETRPE